MVHHDHSPLPVVAGRIPSQPLLNELTAVKYPDGQVETIHDGTFPDEANWLHQQKRRLQGKEYPALAPA